MMVDGPARISLITSAGDIETVLVPSMGLSQCAAKDHIASLDMIVVGDTIKVSGSDTEEGIVPCEKSVHYVRVYKEVSAEFLGISFNYRVTPEGYRMVTDMAEMSVDPDFIQGFILTATADVEAMKMDPAPSEGAPTMQLRVYKNTKNESALDWAQNHPLETNIELAVGTPRTVMVEHVSAVLFKADGLYASDVYVATHGGFVYVFTGAYADQSPSIVKDFTELLSSVVFLEQEVLPEPSEVSMSGTLTMGLQEMGTVGQVRITPRVVLEDSRCPSDVVCIQAGTVRVEADLASDVGQTRQEFMLNVPVTTEGEVVMLTVVAPEAHSQNIIADTEYRFTFTVTPRD
jgi:hypothetical protein